MEAVFFKKSEALHIFRENEGHRLVRTSIHAIFFSDGSCIKTDCSHLIALQGVQNLVKVIHICAVLFCLICAFFARLVDLFSLVAIHIYRS